MTLDNIQPHNSSYPDILGRHYQPEEVSGRGGTCLSNDDRKMVPLLSCYVARHFTEMPFLLLRLFVMVAVLNLSFEFLHRILIQSPSNLGGALLD